MEVPMNNHLLVALGDNPAALHGVRFVSLFFPKECDLKLTLFAAYPGGPQVWEEEKSYETITAAESFHNKAEKRYRRALNHAKSMLKAMGFADEDVDTKCIPQMGGLLPSIAREGVDGLYDAIVLGKRGLKGIEEIMEQSVTEEALGYDTKVPVWICRSPDEDSKNVLLCLDGSDAAYHAADHASFILGQATQHSITMLQVLGNGEDTVKAEEVFAKARTIMLENGLDASRINTRVAHGGKAYKTILDVADEGDYAAIAVGRTGVGKGLLTRWFLGSVAEKLMQHIKGRTLWLSR